MVGHTGVIPAVVRAVETADACLGEVVEAVERAGGVTLITADHGNAETILEEDGASPHTAHTTNPVPLILTVDAVRLRTGGEVAEIVPTALALLGVEIRRRDAGHSLVSRLASDALGVGLRRIPDSTGDRSRRYCLPQPVVKLE